MANPRRFLWIWLLSIVGLGISVVAVNLIVDPYDVFGTPRIKGVTLRKPAAKNHALLAKTYQEARFHPITVLIGSSSTHIGIDAASPRWPASMRPVYNYGIPGGYATSTSLHTMQEAVSAGGVKNAVVFLDFQNFFVPEQPSRVMSEDDLRYRTLPDGTSNPHRPLQIANDMFLSLVTMGALVDSITTIAGQKDPNLLNLAANGSSTEADFINVAHTDGMFDLFAQKDDFEAQRAARLKQIMARWQGELPNLEIIRAMISLARRNGVALTLVISPHHGDALEIYWRDGLWSRLEQLKVALAHLAADQGGAVTVWDFMDYTGFNTEPVPQAGDRHTPTNWFWEPTHFKKQLGEIMIQRMFGQGASAFGTQLTSDTVLGHNALIRAQRQARVCDPANAALLTALTTKLSDGCGPVLEPRGPT